MQQPGKCLGLKTCRVPWRAVGHGGNQASPATAQRLIRELAAWAQGPGILPTALEATRPGRQPAGQEGEHIFQAIFLIFVQDYQPELVEVDLAAPCDFDVAMAAVTIARGHRARYDFPVLVPAHPQTLAGIGLLLALPDWDLSGTPILLIAPNLTADTSPLLCLKPWTASRFCTLRRLRYRTMCWFILLMFLGRLSQDSLSAYRKGM